MYFFDNILRILEWVYPRDSILLYSSLMRLSLFIIFSLLPFGFVVFLTINGVIISTPTQAKGKENKWVNDKNYPKTTQISATTTQNSNLNR